jgi:hypothetical protein
MRCVITTSGGEPNTVAAGSPPGRQLTVAPIRADFRDFRRESAWHALRNRSSCHPQLGDASRKKKVMEQSRLKVCYVITQRGEKKYWNRVGVAFLNHDGSINVKLESLPVAGDFQIRDYVARDENAGTTLRGKNGSSDDEAFAA